jgi:hypothetical protein
MLYEYGFGGKWLELRKEIAPGVKRVALLRNPTIAAGAGQFGAIQASAPSLGVEVRTINLRDAGEIERAITAFAQPSNGGWRRTGSRTSGGRLDRGGRGRSRSPVPILAHHARDVRWRLADCQPVPPADSERFRVAPRTGRSRRARLRVRETGCTG